MAKTGLTGSALGAYAAYAKAASSAAMTPRPTTGRRSADAAARSAAHGAANAAYLAALAAATATTGDRAADSSAYATDAAAEAATDGVGATGAAHVWAAVVADAQTLERGMLHGDFGKQPLWPGSSFFDGGAFFDDEAFFCNPPAWAADQWRRLKQHLLAVKEGWEVWTDWYDAILGGRPLDPEFELKKALIPDEVWKQGPATVNAEIARLIAEHRLTREDRGDPPDPPGRPPPLGPEPGPHEYDPATAGLAELRVIFEGDLRDGRVEAELSRFATLLRRRLLDVTARRDIPLVLGNNMQVDYLGLHRLSIASGSADSNWLITLTVVSMLWAMTADYKDVKEGLAEIRSDVQAAVASAIEAFTDALPDDPPLSEPRRDLVFRDDGDVLADLLDKERQARLRGLAGDEPAR